MTQVMGELWQQFGVGVALSVAVFYLATRVWRLIVGRAGTGGCGGCDKCPAASPSATGAAPPPVVAIDLSFGQRSTGSPR